MLFFERAKENSADVYRETTKIGTLSRTRNGSIFEYDLGFLSKLKEEEKRKGGAAFHLPYSRTRIETFGVNLHPYFAGLLPEGLRLKALIKRVKTSEDDLLSLLIAAGADCIGDIFVLPKGMSPQGVAATVDLGKLEDLSFRDLFTESISEQGRLDEVSLPGVQDKVSASMISFPIRRIYDQNSYLLKLTPAEQPRLVQNEYFFLQMAQAMNLKVNQAKIVKDKNGEEGLLVRRFDRMVLNGSRKGSSQGPSQIIPLHQEDACQFLNRYPSDKYLISLSEIAQGLQLCSTPILEVAKLLRLKAFSYLIGNGDLHAKNVSIYSDLKRDLIELTPAYDLLSTLPYGDQKMALKMEGRDDNLQRRNFVEFGERFQLRGAVTHSILDEICEVSPRWIDRLEEIGFDQKKTDHLRRVMKKRREDLGTTQVARSLSKKRTQKKDSGS